MCISTIKTDRLLVFDIGLHNGDDSEYYLHLGFNVVGVEANPLLAENCMHRFEREIAQGRMKVLNVGVLRAEGLNTFYRSLRDDAWSSFTPEKGKKNGEWEPVLIDCVTTRRLISTYGKPFFMKVDIEGADIQTLDSLTRDTAPEYISLELNCTDPTLQRLSELGYSAFKLINGETFWSTPPIFKHEICWRGLRKIARHSPLVRSTVSRFPQRFRAKSDFDPPYRYSPTGYLFGPYSSGPFGEDARGDWLAIDEAFLRLQRLQADYRRSQAEHLFWWDVHARHALAL